MGHYEEAADAMEYAQGGRRQGTMGDRKYPHSGQVLHVLTGTLGGRSLLLEQVWTLSLMEVEGVEADPSS